MSNLYFIRYLVIFLLFFNANAYSADSTHLKTEALKRVDSNKIELKRVSFIQNSSNEINGLDNPRTAVLAPDGKQVFVASADDDALAIFDVDENFTLTLSQIFRNDEVVSGFVGATRVILSDDGMVAYVVSFYDSALVILEQNAHGTFEYKRTISDTEKWFSKTGAPIAVAEEQDKLALLGAYDITKTADNKQLLVASSASNALSIFNIGNTGEITFKQAIRDTQNSEYALSGAVSVITSPNSEQIFLASYAEDAITIFNRSAQGEITFSQTLKNKTMGIKDMVNPHRLVMSTDGQFLYVACGGGNSVVVFVKNSMGKFNLLQSISNNEKGISGLAGGVGITLSPDQKNLFIAAEEDNAVVVFDRSNNGLLKLNSILQDKSIEGASSVNVSADGKHLFVTSGNESNAISVYQIKN